MVEVQKEVDPSVVSAINDIAGKIEAEEDDLVQNVKVEQQKIQVEAIEVDNEVYLEEVAIQNLLVDQDPHQNKVEDGTFTTEKEEAIAVPDDYQPVDQVLD